MKSETTVSPSNSTAAAAAAKSLQSCPSLCDPMDGSPPGSPIPGILQQEYWSGLPLPSPSNSTTGYLPKEKKNTNLRRYICFHVYRL